MNVYVIAILAWVAFSPVFGVVLGAVLRRAGRPAGDPGLNYGRPAGLPVVIAHQVVAVKHATSRVPG
jgi:hypothetical protein